MDAMTKQGWRRAASRMVSALGADARNGRVLADPWSRAAHCMVAGWRIRLSRPLAEERVRTRPRPTWQAWARLESELSAAKARLARSHGWRRWAAARVTPARRYIPKGKRRW